MKLRLLALVLASTALHGSAGGQSLAPASPKPLAYEIVSVKVNKSQSGMMRFDSTPAGLRLENVRLRDLITSAYSLDSPMDEQVTGLPKWAEDMHFDFEAKVGEEDMEAFKKLNDDRKAPLLLAALQERFKLKSHEETRELPEYSLVLAKGGPKMKLAKEGDTYENGLKFKDKPAGAGSMTMTFNNGAYHAEFQGVPMEQLVANVSYQVHRLVKDDTGLKGKYDVKLDWSPDEAADSTVPGIFTALEEQLGLKLVPTKGPVQCVVVDHVEEPTEN